MRQTLTSRFTVALGALVAAVVPVVGIIATPASADEFALTASFGFDQTSYQPTDTTHLTITLTNNGDTDISGVIADCNRNGDPYALNSFDGWGALSGKGSGTTIPANSSVTFHVDQPMPSFAQQAGYVSAPCVFGPEPDGLPQPDFPGGTATATVPGLTSATVLQFVRSDNTTVPVAGLRVRITDVISQQELPSSTTDANGEIILPTLPAGKYELCPQDGYQIPAGQSDILDAYSPGSLTYLHSYEITPPAGS